MPDTPDAQSQIPPAPTQMVYAVRGTDRISGQEVNTVIEAPNVKAARRITDRKSLDVAELSVMHPLNGKNALLAAQANPEDRFNQSRSSAPLAEVEPPPSTEFETTPKAQTADSAPPTQAPPLHTTPASFPQRAPNFSGPAKVESATAGLPWPGSFAAAVLLTGLSGLVYFAITHHQPEGALAGHVSSPPRQATAAVASRTDDLGIIDVAGLIAAAQSTPPAPILPRSQRGPGQSAYLLPASPDDQRFVTMPVQHDKSGSLVLTAVSRRNHNRPATATVNRQSLRPGQSVNGHTLVQILDDSVVFERNGHLIAVDLTTQAHPASH